MRGILIIIIIIARRVCASLGIVRGAKHAERKPPSVPSLPAAIGLRNDGQVPVLLEGDYLSEVFARTVSHFQWERWNGLRSLRL